MHSSPTNLFWDMMFHSITYSIHHSNSVLFPYEILSKIDYLHPSHMISFIKIHQWIDYWQFDTPMNPMLTLVMSIGVLVLSSYQNWSFTLVICEMRVSVKSNASDTLSVTLPQTLSLWLIRIYWKSSILVGLLNQEWKSLNEKQNLPKWSFLINSNKS